MMNNGRSSSTEQDFDPGSDFFMDLDAWINNCGSDSGANEGDTTINPNYPSQPLMNYPSLPLMPIAEASPNFGEDSSNVPQFEFPQQMMTSSSSMAPGSSIDPLHGSGQNILSSSIKTLSNHTVQSSQSHGTDFNQYQPIQHNQTYLDQSLQHNQTYQINQSLMQQAFNNNYVQQPQTHPFTNQSNITFDNQMSNQLLHYQMPSNQLLPSTVPMVNYTQTGNLHNDQALWVQMQQQPTQNQLPSQQMTGTLEDLISLGGQQQQQGSNEQRNLKAPVGFATPEQFSSSDEYRQYVVRQQIPIMRERYYIKLHQMLNNAMQSYAQATTVDDLDKYKNIIPYMERMLRFLNVTTAESMPGNDQTVYTYMNVVVNFMTTSMRDKSGGYSQHCEPVHQSPSGPLVQLLNQSQMATNLEPNLVNFNQNFNPIFNQNFNSRIPVTQQSRMPSSLDNRTFQIGPSIVQPSTVLFPKQQMNSGPNTSSVIGSGSPIGFLSNPTAANYPSHPLNHQPPYLNSEKLKQPMQPMHITNEFTKPRIHGMSPLGSRLVSHYPPNQLPVPSSVNPISQQTSVPSQTFDVNSLLSTQAIARSPFLLSSSSTPSSGMPSLTAVENQKLAAPTGTPYQEPQNQKDAVQHLTEVVKSISYKALSSSLNDISAMEKVENIIPHCIPTNLVGQYMNNDADNEPRPHMRRENDWALLKEIKDTNNKLMETIIHVVFDLSEENITIQGGHDGVILKCLFRNVCFSDLLGPNGCIISEKKPEFAILFLVPFDYPATRIRIFKSGPEVFQSELCWKLYEEMLIRFDTSTRGTRGKLCVGELASSWDASGCAVMTEFLQKLGGKNFSLWYGAWESCLNGSSGSN